MFTTEDTKFTERKEHNGRGDSSVFSVFSVVKYVTRNLTMRIDRLVRLFGTNSCDGNALS